MPPSHVKAIQRLQPCLCDCEPGINGLAVVKEVDVLAVGDSNVSGMLKFSCELKNCIALLGEHEKPKGVTFQEAIKRNGHIHLSLCR